MVTHYLHAPLGSIRGIDCHVRPGRCLPRHVDSRRNEPVSADEFGGADCSVAYEYISTQSEKHGSMILSEFAG